MDKVTIEIMLNQIIAFRMFLAFIKSSATLELLILVIKYKDGMIIYILLKTTNIWASKYI